MEGSLAHPIRAEIKELEKAIRGSLNAPTVNIHMQEICRIDGVQHHEIHKGEFQKKVLSVIDQRSSQFASIAQNLLTHTVSKIVAAKSPGNATAQALVATTSSAYSVARGAQDIHELRDYILCESSATQVHLGLPSFELMLIQSSGNQISEQMAAEIANYLT